MPIVQHEALRTLGSDLLVAAGVPPEDADIVANHLAASNLVGHDSHGVRFLPNYINQWREHYVRWEERSVEKDTPAFAIIDGKGGNGIVAVTRLTELAVKKARYCGFGFVGLRNVSHIGRLGDYPPRITAEGMIGMVWMNGGSMFLAPFGSAERRLRPEPIAIGIPRKDGSPFVLDMTMSTVAGGKIAEKLVHDEPLPDGWVIDRNGEYVNDAAKYENVDDNAILPLGGLQFGHKGYGLAMMIEMIVGPLTGAGCTDGDGGGGGIAIMALDVAQFTDMENHFQEVEKLAAWVKSARPLPGVERIYAPGEMEEENRKKHLAEGIDVAGPTWQQLVELGNELGVKMPAVN